MAIEKMRLLRLAGSKENIEEFLVTAFATYDLHAELAAKVVNDGNGGLLMTEDNTYSEFLSRLDNISNNLQSNVRCAFDGVSVFTKAEIEKQISIVEKNFEKITETKLSQSNLSKDDRKAINYLREFDISKLNSTYFVDVHFGRMPLSGLEKMDLYSNFAVNLDKIKIT